MPDTMEMQCTKYGIMRFQALDIEH